MIMTSFRRNQFTRRLQASKILQTFYTSRAFITDDKIAKKQTTFYFLQIQRNLLIFIYYLSQEYLKIYQTAFYFYRIIIIFYRMSKKSKPPTSQQTQLYDKITKIESKIIDKVSHLKKSKPRSDCRHFQGNRGPCESYDPSTDYYQKFWKCFLLNELCYARLRDSQSQLKQLENKVQEVEELFSSHQQLTKGKGAKRLRRQAHQLVKSYNCPYPKCFKNYGAQIALNLHIKLKHNGGTKTQREKAAQLVWQARESKKPIPMIYINLPPGFIQEYAKTKKLNSESISSPSQQIYQEGE